jgi:uncharacterized membrane protein YraQ (UPF0718 family)
LGEAAPYTLFGVFVAGVIQAFVNQDKIVKYLGKGAKSVFLAALFGIPMPLCSCGVVPMAISLRKNGASKGSVLSFLISTPETGVDSISLSYALLGPFLTIFRPIAAIIMAITTGLAENIFGSKDNTEPQPEKPAGTCPHCRKTESGGSETPETRNNFWDRLKTGISYAFIELLGDLAKWLLLGITIAGIISYFMPRDFVEIYLSSGWKAMFIMLLTGVPLYVCASASTPIAAALIAKGMSPGVALVFLLAGPATNITSVLAVGKFLGKRSVFIYLTCVSVFTIAMGLLLNRLYFALGLNIKSAACQACGGTMLPHPVMTISAITLLALILNASLKRNKACEIL